MVTAIVVKLELGHTAKAKDVPTLEGHTHDWKVFVKGADGIQIESFVDKITFWLHESYSPSKYVIKHPPYEVRQSGYAGFNILIDVHFKTKSEPKQVRFHYDMFLHTEDMPPVNHTRVEMLTFTSPASDFKEKLLQAGGEIHTSEATANPEEKKRKESRNGESSKHRSSSKKHDKEKSRSKTEQRVPSRHEPKEEGRRSLATDSDAMKKKKVSDKTPNSSSVEKSHKDKVAKLKIKLEKGNQISLFSRDDSIDIKQIKKEIPKKEEQPKKHKEKKSSPPAIKVKKEVVEKPEKSFPIEKKKKKKHHESSKAAVEAPFPPKPKKRRTVSSSSSSDDERTPHRKKVTRSDSDRSSDEKHAKKRHKREKPETKKLVKKIKKEAEVKRPSPTISVSVSGSNTVAKNVEINHTPPSDREMVASRTPEFVSKEKKRKSLKSRDQTKSAVRTPSLTVRAKEPSTQTFLERKIVKKEKHSPRSSESFKRTETPMVVETSRRESGMRPPTTLPVKGMSVMETSDSDTSDDEEIHDRRKSGKVLPRSAVSPSSSHPSVSPRTSPIPPPPLPPIKDEPASPSSDEAFSYDAAPAQKDTRSRQSSSSSSSDEDDGIFEPFPERDHPQNVAPEMSDDDRHEPVSDYSAPEEVDPPFSSPPSPLVAVHMGEEMKSFPDLNAELFNQLRALQISLSEVTDAAITRKIAVIVRKSGKFAMEGDAMDFDLCALDRKTIQKIQKCLKVS